MPLKPVQSSECSQKKKGKRGLRRQTQSLSALALKGSTSLNLYNVTCQLHLNETRGKLQSKLTE